MIAEKLRKAVLQAAIQGKLTEQLPEDGDARDLLKEIQQEKARLVKEGKVKKEPLLPPIKEEDIPFEIPLNWVWCRLGELIELISGQDMQSHFYHTANSGVPYITGASNFSNGQLTINRYTGKPKSIAYQGDLLLTCKGTVGEMAFLNEEKVHIARQVMAVRKIVGVNLSYIQLFLSYYVYELNALAKSMIPGISRSSVLFAMVPLPPLAEQLRIIEKSENIQLEITKLEADESKLEALQKAFPKQLKNAILQAAIQGNLTEQLPEDGDARDLLKQIQQEKASLVKAGKLKRENLLASITEDEIPFDIPDNWAWVRLADCCDMNTGNSIPKHTKEYKYSIKIDGLPYIATKDVSFDNSIDYENGVYIPFGEPNFRVAPQNSILLCIEGGSAGRKIGIIDQDVCFGNKLCKFEPITIIPKLIFYYLQSSAFQSQFVSEMTGIIGGVGVNRIKNLPIPIPPIEEQQRIVDRMDQLLPLCEKLD